MTMPNRRHILSATGAAPFALSSDVATAQTAPTLTFNTPAEHVRAFLKLHVSLEPTTIFHLYVGTWEALVPGRAPVNLVASTTVIRRQVEVRPEGHHISIWEATVYHRPGETEPLDSFVNPLNDRAVRPFHQREGRGQFLWAPDGPRAMRGGEWTPVNRTTINGNVKPFALDWSEAGERIWVSRYSSGVYLKNPLDPAIWKLECAGPDLLYSEKTTNSGLVREVADPAVVNASATYSLHQIMVWWPWLLMGQQPGFLAWNTNGVKLTGVDQVPAAARKLIEKKHPTFFAPGAPWEGSVNLWTDYPKQRQPEKV